jgi:hypothetical protein
MGADIRHARHYPVTETKTCAACKAVLTLTEFYRATHVRPSDGLPRWHAKCKECHKKREVPFSSTSGLLKPGNMDVLKDRIVRQDFDKYLIPLMLYKGNSSFGRVQRLWNFAITMMESNATTLTDALYLSQNVDFTHLVGPGRKLKANAVYSILRRLRGNPRVTDNIPGFTRYINNEVNIRTFSLEQIPIDSPNRVRRPWRNRIYVKSTKVGKLWTPRSTQPLNYPYLIHKPQDGNLERTMMLAVNAAVPRGLPDFLRADICQDLIVAILSGDIKIEDLRGSVREYTGKILKMHPIKYGDLSLDASIGDDDDRTFGDILSEASYRGLEW